MLTVLSSWIDFLARDTQVPTEIMRRGSDGQAVLAETAGEVCDGDGMGMGGEGMSMGMSMGMKRK